ncbi:unnamed protein product [Cochlearia groenlandica]
MNMNEAKTETSSSSKDTFLPLKKRMRSPLDDDDATTTTTNTKKLALTTTKPTLSNKATAKYKGVVQQQNGHWGAQIYTDHKRIWLGTFKSDVEAATAYDSASIKLRSFDANSHRNFPWSDLTVHEPDFQECYTTEAVLNMIRDGSYQHKFKDFLKIRSKIASNINILGSNQEQEQESKNCLSCTQLFEKELTPSDVSKLNRLVIPKKYAVKYLPYITDKEEGEIGIEGAEIVFYDKAMRQWKFRYCYWRSSQSFVFTRGWNGFVKEKNLKEKDVVVFYDCEVPSNVKSLEEGQSKRFLMIDIHCFQDNSTVPESSVDVMKTVNIFRSKLKEDDEEEEETKTEKSKGGFMLFGVRIQ